MENRGAKCFHGWYEIVCFGDISLESAVYMFKDIFITLTCFDWIQQKAVSSLVS